MRIAFFTDTYIPNVDGVVRHILYLRQYLEEKGDEVYIFAPGTKEQKKNNKDRFVYYFTSTTFKPYPDYKVALFPFPSALRLIREIRPDIIHVHGIATTGLAAIYTAKQLKIPIIATFHTMVTEAMHYLSKNKGMQKFLGEIAWKYLVWYYNNFDAIIVPSNFVLELLKKQGVKKPIVKIPNGADSSFFSPKENARKRWKFKGTVFLYVGRIAKEKNLDLIVDSAETIKNKIKDAQFVFAGKGPYLDELKRKVEKRNMKYVKFLGYVKEGELPYLYSSADLFLFPSHFDTSGLAALESLMCNTPVIASGKCGVTEYVKDGTNGYLFAENSEFPEKVVMGWENIEKLKKNARNSVLKFDVKNTCKQILSFYREILERNEKK